MEGDGLYGSYTRQDPAFRDLSKNWARQLVELLPRGWTTTGIEELVEGERILQVGSLSYFETEFVNGV